MQARWMEHPDDGHKVWIREFDSMTDLIGFCETDCPANGRSSRRASQTKDSDFSGIYDWPSAKKMALEGYSAPRANIETLADQVRTQLVETIDDNFVDYFDVTGHSVDIGRYVTGEPECMLASQLSPVTRHGKIIRILANPDAMGSTSSSKMFEHGAAMVAIVEILRILGFNTEIYCEIATPLRKGAMHTVLTKIKGAADDMDIDLVSYAIAHPSYLRRVVFNVFEHETWEICQDYGLTGYGTVGETQCEELIEASYVMPPPDPTIGYNAQWIIGQLKGMGIISGD